MKNLKVLLLGFLIAIAIPVMAFKTTDSFIRFNKASGDFFIYFGTRSNTQAVIKWDNVLSKLQFSNDGGSNFSNFGSGSGSGGGGVNLLTNSSFEDGGSPIANWTATGGTLTQETFAFGIEGDEKFAKFITSGAGQFVESDLTTIPNDFSFGMMADIRFASSTAGEFDLVVLDSANNILASSTLTGDFNFAKSPVMVFNTIASGSEVKLRIVSTVAGEIHLNNAYTGSNKGFLDGDSLNICSARISNTGSATIVSEQGDCLESVNFVSTGLVDITFKTGFYSVIPSIQTSTENQSMMTQSINRTVNGFRVVVEENTAGALSNQPFSIQMTKQGVDVKKTQSAFAPEQASFNLDVNIGGSNITGPGTTATYTELTNSGLDMVINPGSVGAEIPCSTTNSSSGPTCSAGDESLGVAFIARRTGTYRFCAEFYHIVGSDTAVYQLIETPNNAQAILQEGNTRKGANGDGVSGENAFNICGNFVFNTTGKKTIRLMFEKQLGATHIIYADRAAALGQRDIHITGTLLTFDTARPIVNNMVDTSGAKRIQLEACRIDNNGTATINDESNLCNWMLTSTLNGTGVVDLVFNPFAAVPNCFCTTQNPGTDRKCEVHVLPTNSTITIRTSTASTNPAQNVDFTIFCLSRR